MTQSLDQIKQLRERTGVGIGKCKEALLASGGDLQGAVDHLRKQGMATAVKRQGRETSEGALAFGETETTLALVELNAETDFVAQNERFLTFLRQLSEQVARDLPKTNEELLAAPFTGEPSSSVDQFRASLVQALGENVQLRRFDAFAKGASHSLGLYLHAGAKIAAVVQINGSSDEVELARDLAMHVAASAPEFLEPESVPESVLEKEREIARSQMQGKPPQILEGIVAGKVRAYCQTACLTEQEFIKDSSAKVKEIVSKRAAGTGRDLRIARFLRWSIGD